MKGQIVKRLYFYTTTPNGLTFWRWRLVSRNGKILGASSEAFNRYEDVRKNAQLVTLYKMRPDIKAVSERG